MEKELTATEFYRRRDDRTNRLTDNRSYHDFHIRVTSEDSSIHSYIGQVQLITAANMLARWCRRIEFGFGDAPLVDELRLGGCATLHDRIQMEISQADPFGNFTFKLEPSSIVEYTLHVGKKDQLEKASFVIDTDGWNAYAGIDYDFSIVRSLQNNPVGAAFAACIGVADAFKVATRQSKDNRVRRLGLSLFNFACNTDSSPVPDRISLGKMQLIGAGSVGSAIAYLLRMMPLDAQLSIVDHDLIEIENLNRSPLFGIGDNNLTKAEVTANYLKGHIPVESFPERYDEFIQGHGRKPGDTDIIIPVANEYNIRADVENNFPPIQVYGTTTTSWGVNYHRHVPLSDDDCSMCRFPPGDIHPNFACSMVQVETENKKRIDAALPFLSMAAAVVTVADLIKLQLPDYPYTPNFAFLDFLGRMESTSIYSKPKKSGCICSHRSNAIHTKYLDSTRYFLLAIKNRA